MAMNRYEVGEYIKITAEFRDESGTLEDPTKVIFKMRAMTTPDPGVITQMNATRASLGSYFVQITTWTPKGRWAYRFEGQGNVGQAREGEFLVEGSEFYD